MATTHSVTIAASAARPRLLGALALFLGAIMVGFQALAISTTHDVVAEQLRHEVSWWQSKEAALEAERRGLEQRVSVQASPAVAADPQTRQRVRMEALLSIADQFGFRITGTPTATFSSKFQGANAILPSDAEGLMGDTYIGFPGRFAALFGVGENQVRGLQLAFDHLRQRILDDLAARMVISFPQPDQIVVRIPASPSSSAYHEELLAILRETLGESGASAFAKFNGVAEVRTIAHNNMLDQYFQFFGRDELTYTITKEAEGYSYVVNSSWPGWNTRPIKVANVERINWNFPPAAKLLPTGF